MHINEPDHGLLTKTVSINGIWKTSLDRLKPKIKKDPHLIVKSGTGVYYIDYVDFNNKRHRTSTKTTDKLKATRIFNNWLREFKSETLDYANNDKSAVVLSDFIEEFLQSRTPPRISESTHRLYRDALNRAVEAWGSDIYMAAITTRHIDKFISVLLRDNLKPPTINKNYRHLKGAIRQAIKWEYMPPILDWPKEIREKKIARYMTKEQLQIYFDYVANEQEWFDFCLLSCYTGLRSGEILRLTNSDIDNPKGYIRITSEQKNKDESRIPINKIAREILDRYKSRDKIFKYKGLAWMSRKFKKTLKRCGLPDTFRFHDLRHTYASHMAMAGEDVLTIKELMRHKSISSTMVYAKLSPAHLKSAANRVDYGLTFGLKKDDKKVSQD